MSLLGRPDNNQCWQVVLDDASNIPLLIDHSHLLDEVAASGSRFIAFTPLLLTRVCQSPARGYRFHPTTWGVGLDNVPFLSYHLTDINTQLQRSSLRCRSSPVSKNTVSSERIAPSASTRLDYRAFLMKVSCWQHHFLLLRSAPARQAGYAGGVGRPEEREEFW